ncbi:hypothetical protein BHE90_002578 [Fusarium euwallaceae]|uniref:NACHT domain-containing protein n=1 Tax=Fusarium euwallaceae TaxID=1147111 RepID=A0A430M4F7_9HYPO|nr:hypothetical protein BHE90_002578 [Fusarium euwallaceae]
MTTRKKVSSPALYSIAWVAALPIERAAATALLHERHDEPEGFDQHANDANAYDWGEVGQHNVVIASLPAGVYGTTSAAITASHLLSSSPHIRIGLLVGIGGGIPRPGRDIRLGDIVVSQPDGQNGGVVQYDLGKAKINETWERKGSLNMPPPVLLNALGKLQAEHEIEDPKIMDLLQGLIRKYPRMKKHYVHQGEENDRLFSSDYEHYGGSTCDACDSSEEVERPERETTDPEIHYGTVASGNTLVKDAAVRDIILQRVGEECLCVEMEAAGLMNTFPCLVIRGICDYADSHKNNRWQRYAAATAAAFAVELLGFVRAKQLEETPSARELMKSIAKVDHKITHLKESIDSSYSKMVLNRLPTAAGAAHDSSDSWLQATCLEDTRVDVLREIYEWASDPDSNSTTLFWLNGMAGTGKSTISRTVAQHLAKEGTFGGSFFFKKGEIDRSNPSKLFTSLAAGLSRWQSAVSQYIGEAIDQNPQIFDQMPHQQFSKLILEPLSQVTLCSGKPIVIVIDALDECQHHSITSIILDILPRARSLRHPRLKFFLTSRPELPIQAGFPHVERRNTYQDLILQNVPADIIRKDLETFLRRTIEQIRIRYDDGSGRLPPNWPGKDAIQRLVNMATPLFIVASTACRFLEDRRLGNPKRQMDKILAVKDRAHASMLDQMYLAVLSQQLEGGPDSYTPQQKSQIVGEFRLIVGSVILLSTPLAMPVLAQLLHGDQDVSDFQETLENRLELLHSVLSVPPPSERLNSPVRTLHLSFRDFLVDSERRDVNPFWVDEAKAQLVLAESCLRVMRTSLRENMCELGSPDTRKTWVTQEKVNHCLSPHVQYACLHWVDHVEQAPMDLVAGKVVLEFLEIHLLHWLEALSFLNRVLESVIMVERLHSATQDAGLPQLSELLSDLIRFTGANAGVMDLAPLQVYSMALVFAPLKSRVRIVFKAQVPDWISIQPQVKDHWSDCLHRLRNPRYGGQVSHLSFSPDSKLLASLTRTGVVSVWDVKTGVQVLEQNSGTLFDVARSVVFSTDSALVIVVSVARIKVWRVATGECVYNLCHPQSNVTSTTLLTPGLIASGSGMGDIRVWEVGTGRLVSKLQGHRKPVIALAVSADEKLLASGSDDGKMIIWQRDNWIHVETLVAPEGGAISRVAFSSDSTLIAAAISSLLGDMSMTVPVTSLPLLTPTPSSFLPRSRPVEWKPHASPAASATFLDTAIMDHMDCPGDGMEGKVVVFSMDSCQPLQMLCNYQRSPDLMFRSGSVLVISDHFGREISTWQADTGQLLHELLDDPRLEVTATAFSRDPIVKIYTGLGRTEIWYADSREYRQCCDMTDGDVSVSTTMAISANLKLIASAIADGEVNVYQVSLVEDDYPQLRTQEVIEAVSPEFSQHASFDSTTPTWAIWETMTGTLLDKSNNRLPGDRIIFSCDSRTRVLVGERVILYTIYGMQSLTVERPMRDNSLYKAAFSPTSELIATGYFKTVQIWQVATGKCIQTLRTFSTNHISSLVFSSDSKLVGAAQGEIVQVWDISTGLYARKIRMPPGGGWSTGCLAISSRAKLVAIASDHGVVSIWHASTGKLLGSLDTGIKSSRLSFENGDTQLLANSGLIGIDLSCLVGDEAVSTEPTFSARPIDLSSELSRTNDDGMFAVLGKRAGIGIDRSKEWFTWNGQPFFLIPVEYSKQHVEVNGSSVLFRPISGRPTVITFNPKKLTELFT